MNDVAKVALGAFLALASGFFTQLFVIKQKELTDRIDELVRFIWEYADISSKYWAGEFRKKEIQKIEARMVGMDHFIGTMLSSISANAKFDMKHDLERLLVVLSNSTTGGNFQVNDRQDDPLKSTEIYVNASELCIRLRTERRKLLRLFAVSLA